MSTRQKKSLLLLVIMTAITTTGFFVLQGVIGYQQKMLRDNLGLLNQISQVKDLYIKVLSAENAKLSRKEKYDLIKIIQDPNYYIGFIEPIKGILESIDISMFADSEQKYIEIVRKNSVKFVTSTKLAGLNEQSLQYNIDNFESAIQSMQNALRELNMLQKVSIEEKINFLEKQKIWIAVISIVIMMILITFSVYFAHKINNQIQVELRAEKAQTELDIQEKLAEDLQKALLPIQQELMDEHFDIAGIMQTADSVGGDYYDYIKKGDDRWFIIGDVTGHGLSSAVVMLCLKFATSMTIHLSEILSPNKVLRTVNYWVNLIKSRFDGELKKKTATFLVLHVDSEGVVEYAGNHPDMLVYDSQTQKLRKAPSHQGYLSIGLLNDTAYDNMLMQTADHRRFVLNSGDKILLYTDGITEARISEQPVEINGKQVECLFEEEGLMDLFHQHSVQNVRHIVNEIIDYSNNLIVDDDITLLAIEKK